VNRRNGTPSISVTVARMMTPADNHVARSRCREREVAGFKRLIELIPNQQLAFVVPTRV